MANQVDWVGRQPNDPTIVYHAGVFGKLRAEKNISQRAHMHARCISFAYLDDRTKWALDYCIKKGVRVFCDSGAFTLQKENLSAREIENYVDRYAQFLQRYKTHFDFYAPVDYARNAAAVRLAMRAMHQRGRRPAPVFHGNDDIQELERPIAAGQWVREYTIQTCRLWKERKATDKVTYTQSE